MWTRAWLYLKKAGTVILGAAIILWFLTFYPKPPADYVVPVGIRPAPPTEQAGPLTARSTDEAVAQAAELSYSIAGRVGRLLEPVIAPLGFDWRIGTALVGAIAAKEVFVAQMGIVFAVGEADEDFGLPARTAAGAVLAAGGLLHHALRPDLDAVHRHLRRHAAGIGVGQVGPGPDLRADRRGLDRDLRRVPGRVSSSGWGVT